MGVDPPKTFFVRKFLFPFNKPRVWCGSCWKILNRYLIDMTCSRISNFRYWGIFLPCSSNFFKNSAVHHEKAANHLVTWILNCEFSRVFQPIAMSVVCLFVIVYFNLIGKIVIVISDKMIVKLFTDANLPPNFGFMNLYDF